MDNNRFTTKLTLGATVFAGIIPFAFYFNGSEIQFLIDSMYVPIIWILFLFVSVLLLKDRMLSKKQILGLFVFYFFLPLTFYFSEKDIVFVILEQNSKTAIAFWVVAIILLVKFFGKNKTLIAN